MKKRMINLPRWWHPSQVPVWSVWWFVYFAILYFIVWLPGKFNYTTDVHLGPLMIPYFVWTWIAVNVLTIVGLFALYNYLKRIGYFDGEKKEE